MGFQPSDSIPHARRTALSSVALIAFLKRAPDRPLTRLSHSAHEAWRMATPSTTLKYEYAAAFLRRLSDDVVREHLSV